MNLYFLNCESSYHFLSGYIIYINGFIIGKYDNQIIIRNIEDVINCEILNFDLTRRLKRRSINKLKSLLTLIKNAEAVVILQ